MAKHPARYTARNAGQWTAATLAAREQQLTHEQLGSVYYAKARTEELRAVRRARAALTTPDHA